MAIGENVWSRLLCTRIEFCSFYRYIIDNGSAITTTTTLYPTMKDKKYNRDILGYCVKTPTEPCHVILRVAQVVAGVKCVSILRTLFGVWACNQKCT